MSSEPNSGAPMTTVGDNLVGKDIDGCTIVKKIGQGGMGIVYLAEHGMLRRQYVVKILNPALTAAEDTVQRFFREAQSVARLNHPSIVGIQNVGQEGDYYYIRMEYVDGDTVENIVKEQKKLDWKLATKVVLDTAEALSHAHKKGIIHRDIKPENIMLTKNGDVKVMDFGLAKQVQAATKVSVTGQIVGTPFFMSPEQAGGKTTDARSDIYSLGVTYYYLLTGVKPFNGKNLQEIFLKHFFYTPESPKIYTPALPQNVCDVIQRCLKKKKKERYQSAAHLAKDLRIVLGLDEGSLAATQEPATGESDEGSASAEDAGKAGQIGGDPGKTARGVVSRSSDPAIPVVGEGGLGTASAVFSRGTGGNGQETIRTQGGITSDLAAARAELGGEGEPSTMVSGTPNPKKPAVEGEDTITGTAEAVPPPETDGPAAPLQRRGGRVALETTAGASLVFAPGASPLEAPAAPAEADAGVAPPEEAADAGSTVAIPAPKHKSETARKTFKEPRFSRKQVLAAVGGVVLLLVVVGASYQLIASSKFTDLENNYVQVAQTDRKPGDAKAWSQAANDYQDLAKRLDDFGSTFGLSLKADLAATLAQTCRDRALLAGRTAAAAGPPTDPGKTGPDPRKIEAENRFNARMKDVEDLVAKRDYRGAGSKAAEAYEAGKQLASFMASKVRCPIEITADPVGGKIYAVGNNAPNDPIGEIPPTGGTATVLVPMFQHSWRIEVRRPHFKTWNSNNSPVPYVVEKWTHFDATLEREIVRHYPVGSTRPFPLWKSLHVVEPLKVAAPFMIDAQLDMLCTISHDGYLRGSEIRTGAPMWKAPQKIGDYGDPLPGPDILPGRAIVTASADGTITAFDLQSGALVWATNIGSPARAAPRFDASGAHVVVTTANGEVVDLDGNKGNIRWRFPTEASITTRPVIQGNRVFVGSLDERVYAINLDTGAKEAWYEAGSGISAGPVLSGDTLYVGTREGRLHGLRFSPGTADATGKLDKVFVTAAAPSAIVHLVANDTAVYYATANELRAVAKGTAGNKLFDPQSMGSDFNIVGVVPMGDKLAIVSEGGWVAVRDGKTGEPIWSHEIKTDAGDSVRIAAPPVYHNEFLYVVTYQGEVVVLYSD
jgi:outer membrane protein assembly factor BamB/predicted Ser/Thr protein kinase